MRIGLIALVLLELTSGASAACRCGCVRGQYKAICLPTDLVEPICQGLCSDEIREAPTIIPLAGGRQEVMPVTPSEQARPTVEVDPRTGVVDDPNNYNADTRGNQLGTAGVPGGTSNLSTAPAAAAGAGAR